MAKFTRAVTGQITSRYSASGGRLVFVRDNASTGIEWGENGSGIDNTWYGDTTGANMKWDESVNSLIFTNSSIGVPSASITNATITSATVTGALYLGTASTQLQVLEVASRGAITASSPDHYISIGLIASGSVVTGLIPVYASA